jgi:hypothetical protein
VGAVWAACALASKKTARREAATSRLLHIAIMVAAFALLFPRLPIGYSFPVGPLAWPIRAGDARDRVDWPGRHGGGLRFCHLGAPPAGRQLERSVTVKRDHLLIRQRTVRDRPPSNLLRLVAGAPRHGADRWANGAASPGWRWHSRDGG